MENFKCEKNLKDGTKSIAGKKIIFSDLGNFIFLIKFLKNEIISKKCGSENFQKFRWMHSDSAGQNFLPKPFSGWF